MSITLITPSGDKAQPNPGFLIDFRDEDVFTYDIHTGPYKGCKCITPLPATQMPEDPTIDKLLGFSQGNVSFTGVKPSYFIIIDSYNSRIDVMIDYHSRIPLFYNFYGIYTRHNLEGISNPTFISPGHSTFYITTESPVQISMERHVPFYKIVPRLSCLLNIQPKSKEELVLCFINIMREAIYEQLIELPEVRLLTSGGIDSTLLAYICAEHVRDRGTCRVELFNIAFSKSSTDSVAFAALRSCQKLNTIRKSNPSYLCFTSRVISEEIFKSNLREVCRRIAPCPPTIMMLNLGSILYHATRAPDESDLDASVMSGLGPDEYCGAYASIKNKDLNVWKSFVVTARQQLSERNIIRESGVFRNIIYPYLVPQVTAFFDYLLDSEQYNLLRDKEILRCAALLLGAPSELAKRPKQAAQFGSDCAKILRGGGYDLINV